MHIWTDASPKVIASAEAMFNDMRQRGKDSAVSYDVYLSDDIVKLNRIMQFLEKLNVEHIVINLYGMSYILSIEDNYRWMKDLYHPEGRKMSFIFNSMNHHMALPGKVVAGVHNQPVFNYQQKHVEALFDALYDNYEIVWYKLALETEFKILSTWVIEV